MVIGVLQGRKKADNAAVPKRHELTKIVAEIRQKVLLQMLNEQ
jgi:hypothetical protein